MLDYWAARRTFASIVEVDSRHPHKPHPHYVGFALPEIEGDVCPHPLMLWWALLLGLSSLTRYESAGWTDAIDLDSSELAVSLERVLDIAAEKVPQRDPRLFVNTSAGGSRIEDLALPPHVKR